jgi:5-methylcytosine-specific restriction endonuclease McrA
MTKRIDAEDRKQQQLRRLGSQHPQCVVCGESDPRVLEKHHIAGRKHSEDLSIICSNCHRKLSTEQRGQITYGSREVTGPLGDIGYYLLGLADLLEMIVRALRKFGAWLIGEPGQPMPA